MVMYSVKSQQAIIRPLFPSLLVPSLLAVAALGFGGSAFGVDVSKLWLPKSYYKQWEELVEAAETVEREVERCATVIRGGVLLDRSTKEHAIFRISCRDSERKSFAVMVDGDSMKLLGAYSDAAKKRLERLRLKREEEQYQRAERERLKERIAQWDRCRQELDRRTARMRRRTWLTEEMPEPDTSVEGQFDYVADFDAESAGGLLLKYRAHCTVTLPLTEIGESTGSEAVEESQNELPEAAYKIRIGLRQKIVSEKDPPQAVAPEQERQLLKEWIAQWGRCRQELDRRTARMRRLTWLTEEVPEPDISVEGQFDYIADFDAESVDGLLLKYRAHCTVTLPRTKIGEPTGSEAVEESQGSEATELPEAAYKIRIGPRVEIVSEKDPPQAVAPEQD